MAEICLLFGRIRLNRAEFISSLKEVQAESGWVIQALDADKVVSEEHLIFAAQKAMLSFQEGRNIAKDMGMEFLRYASGERQIERALSIGVSDSTARVAIVMIRLGGGFFGEGSNPKAPNIDHLVRADSGGCSFRAEAVKDAFGISDEEICAAGEGRLADLVLERVALVDTFG